MEVISNTGAERKIVYKDRVVREVVEVEKIIEVPVEKIVEKIVEKPVEVVKIREVITKIEVPYETVVEKEVIVVKEVQVAADETSWNLKLQTLISEHQTSTHQHESLIKTYMTQIGVLEKERDHFREVSKEVVEVEKVVYQDKIVIKEVEKVVEKEVIKVVEKETVDARMIQTHRVVELLKGVVGKVVSNEKLIGVPVDYVVDTNVKAC